MNKKKLLIYLTVILSLDLTMILNINPMNLYKSISNKNELSIKLLSSYTVDSSWTVIDPTTVATTSLDDVIGTYISQGKTKLYIKNGTYNLNNSINISSPNIIIYGESKNNTIIVQDNAGKNTMEVTGDNVQVSNLTISNTKDELAFTSKNSNNITLEDCIIYGSPNNSAIAFWGTTGTNDIDAVENNNLTSGNVIRGNIIYSTQNTNSSLDGLIFTKQINGTLEDNTLIGSRIAFYLCRNSQVSDNTIKDSQSNGIRVSVPAYDNKISNNTIDNTLASGICVVRNDQGLTPSNYRASNIEISNNTITNSRYFGIEISNLENSLIADNTIDGTDFDGLYFLYANNLNVLHNKIYNSGLATDSNGRNLWGWPNNLNSGIFLDYTVCNFSLDNNEITNLNNNCIYGIRVQSGGSNLNNSITNNSVSGDFSYGINANIPEQTMISNNLINLITTNLQASTDVDKITLTWNPVDGANNYEMEINGIILPTQVTGTNYVDTNLINNTTYTYRVRAVGNMWSGYLPAKTLPASAPINLSASTDVDKISLNWDSVAGANQYDIELNGQIITQVSSTNYINAGLINNTSYTYRVRAVGGAWSDYLTAKTLPASAPINLSASTDVDKISLNWDSVAGANTYDVELNGQVITQVSGTNYINTGLINNTSYTYRVRAVGGSWSDYLTAKTLPAPPPNQTTGGSVIITPTPPDQTTGGSVIITPAPHNQTTGGSVIITPPPHNQTTGSHGTHKTTISNTSAGSTEVIPPPKNPTGTKLPSPTNINTIPSKDTVTIRWDSVLGATRYEIKIGNHIIDTGANTFYVNTELMSNTTYKYRVRAIGGIWSNLIQAKTLLDSQSQNPELESIPVLYNVPQLPEALPSNLELSDNLEKSTFKPTESVLVPTNITAIPQADSIKITWAAVPGVTDYEIEVDGEILDNGNNTSYVHTGLSSNSYHSYMIRIKGMNWSEITTVKTLNDNISNDNTNENEDSPAEKNISNIFNFLQNLGTYKFIAIISGLCIIGIILLKKFFLR